MSRKFNGIKKNVEIVRGSIDYRNIERLQKLSMRQLWIDENGDPCFYVVRRVDVDEVGNMACGYQVVGLSPVVFAFGDIDVKERQLSVRKIKNTTTGELTDAEPTHVGPDSKYRLVNNIVLFSFSGAEGQYESFRINGATVENDLYYPVSSSASMGKKSKVYFSNHDAEYQFNIMNELTGGLLSEILQQYKDKILSKDDLADILGRISLAATTPALYPKSGVTGNVFYYNASIESKDEEVEIEEIDNCHPDGYGVISDRIGALMAEELSGERVSCPQARRMSWQLRFRGSAGKDHSRAYASHWRFKKMKNMLATNADACYCWINCKKVNLNGLSDKELYQLAVKVDVIASKDEFKWGKYLVDKDEIKPLEIGVVNMSNESTGSFGTQIAFKLIEDEEEALQYVAALVERQLEEESNAEGSIGFKENSVKLNNTTYYNVMNLAREKVATDKLLNNYKVKTLDNTMLKKVANLKLRVNSKYLRMVPEDFMLNNNCDEVLGSREIEYYMPTGEVVKLRVLEAYSPAINREIKEMEELLKENTVMTEEEKRRLINNLRITIDIKSPSQGHKEFEVTHNVSEEEIRQREMSQELLEWFLETPNNCVVHAADNTMKRMLAGSDYDGDDQTKIMSEVTYVDGKYVTGLVYNGKLINDYTSIMVRRRMLDGCGYAALIEYHRDTPVRINKETEEEKSLEEQTAEYFQNLDINSLF